MSAAARAKGRAVETSARRDLERFDVTERAVHWSLAVIVLVELFTGAELRLPALALAIGHRGLVENVHVYVGLLLPVPLAVGLAGPWRRGLAADLRRLNRWPSGEAAWFRRKAASRARVELGKFNPGQKLNAATLCGALLVMLGTGLLMRWAPPSLLSFQTGATLIHDILFLVIGVLVIGHIVMAMAHPDALRSMIDGRVSERWARRHAPRWLQEKGDRAPRRIPAQRP